MKNLKQTILKNYKLKIKPEMPTAVKQGRQN